MEGRMAVFEKLIPSIEGMYHDLYVGNGEHPLRDEVREWRADKDAAKKSKSDCVEKKKDFSTKVKLQFIGAIIAFSFGQYGLTAFVNWIVGMIK
jgi:hypothetical protein